MMATVANGGTRVDAALHQGRGRRARVDSRCRRRRRRRRFSLKPETIAALHDGLWMVVNAAGTGGRARIAGQGRGRQDGDGAGDLDPGRQAPRRARPTWTCATTAGSCSSRRATTRRSRAWCSPSTPSTAPAARRSRRHIIATYFAKQDGTPLPEFAAAAPAPAPAIPRRPATVRPSPAQAASAAPARFDRDDGGTLMFERRLYFHIDWALIVAMLALTGMGIADDLQRHAELGAAAVRVAGLRARPRRSSRC